MITLSRLTLPVLGSILSRSKPKPNLPPLAAVNPNNDAPMSLGLKFAGSGTRGLGLPVVFFVFRAAGFSAAGLSSSAFLDSHI
jgi:hypothetical protein